MATSFITELKRRNVFKVGIAYLVLAWVVIQVTQAAVPALHLPDWVNSLVFLLGAIGFPFALFFAWAFEITPDGVMRESDIKPEHSIAAHTGRKLDFIIIGLLIIALGYFIYESRFASQSSQTITLENKTASGKSPAVEETGVETGIPAKSIAVLPFANRSPNPEDAFFTNGVHDDLLTHLSKIGDMHVISRTSVMGFAATQRKIPDIAKELGVATVMEGAVQRAGNRVRINVQLIDGVTDQHLWAEIYDRELTADNIFDIQSEITLAIAAALKAILTPEDKAIIADRPTQSLLAYDAYMRGMALLRGEANDFNADQVVRAPAAFDAAIAEDPDFGIAHAGKARSLMYDLWVNSRIDKSVISEARAHLDRARVLAPNDVETLVAEGYYHYYGFLDFARALHFIELAAEAAPNDAQVWKLKMFVSRRLGLIDETDSAFEKALSLDPLSTPYIFYYAQGLANLGRFEEAEALMKRISAVDGSLEQGITGQAFIWMRRGNPQRACEVLDSVTPKEGWSAYYEARARCIALLPGDGGKHLIDEALAAIPAEHFEYAGYPEAYNIFKTFAMEAAGRKDEASNLMREIASRISASPDPYPRGWVQPPYLPIDLPGLLGDLDGVRKAARDYEANAVQDSIDDRERYLSIAGAFARAGDPGAAFDYIDRLIKLTGPSQYSVVSIDPAFDELRDHPRYLALQAKYQTWASAQGYLSN